MKAEFIRYLKNPLYWIVLSSGLAVRTVLAYYDFLYRRENFAVLTAGFWSKTGSVTMGFLILLVLIRPFSIDREMGTAPVVHSTCFGRAWLFRRRLMAGSMAAALGVLVLAAANAAIPMLLGRSGSHAKGLLPALAVSAAVAAVGAVGYFVLAACVCDALQNQTAAMCVCGMPFAISYFVDVNAIAPFTLFWFFRYGFFTELLRGRLIRSVPAFWIIWYLLLLGGAVGMAVHRRKECREL